MSESEPLTGEFRLFGKEILGHDYDEEADILYLWRGDKPVEALSLPSAEGHLIRVHPETHEVVGFTIFDFRRRWNAQGSIRIAAPSITGDRGGSRAAEELELVPA